MGRIRMIRLYDTNHCVKSADTNPSGIKDPYFVPMSNMLMYALYECTDIIRVRSESHLTLVAGTGLKSIMIRPMFSLNDYWRCLTIKSIRLNINVKCNVPLNLNQRYLLYEWCDWYEICESFGTILRSNGNRIIRNSVKVRIAHAYHNWHMLMNRLPQKELDATPSFVLLESDEAI